MAPEKQKQGATAVGSGDFHEKAVKGLFSGTSFY
jgi:hypothetical protein